MDVQEYLEFFAQELIDELRPAERLRELTSNSDLLGAYTEAAVRKLVLRIVHPLQLCTGTVPNIQAGSSVGDLPEIDTIIWAANPAPPIFSVGDFGVVPRSSSFGILEIKRSLYTDVAEKLRDRTEPSFVQQRVCELIPEGQGMALGVVCARLRSQSFAAVKELLDSGRVVVLFEEQDDEWKARPLDVARLVNFLARIRATAQACVGKVSLNEELLKEAGA